MKTRASLIALLLGLGGLATSYADPILGGQIFATGGEVTATFTGSDAGYDNLLFLATTSSGTIFEGHLTTVGNTADLGFFSAGTELVFGLNNQHGNTWYTGASSGNVDGVAHAMVDTTGAGSLAVGFEDLFGGGDKDYNDLNFTVNNAGVCRAPSVPDAGGTVMLLGLGLVGLLGFGKHFRKDSPRFAC